MRSMRSFVIWPCLTTLVACLGCSLLSPPRVVEAPPEEPVSPRALEGQQAAQQYAAGTIKDYELVWKLYDLNLDERAPFLDGFVEGFTKAGYPSKGIEYRARLEDAVSGDQFRAAVGLGSRHAARVVTNEQTEGVIRSSLVVSPGISLGWKAGYIRGFSAQRLADVAARETVNETTRRQLHVEAAAAYHALRAAAAP